MLFSQMVEIASDRWLVRQLLSLKRCFGNRAKIGIVVGPGMKTDFCSTITELVSLGHVSSGLEWMDSFLPSIFTVYESPDDDFTVIPSRYSDNGPPCPWETAGREQEKARARVRIARAKNRVG